MIKDIRARARKLVRIERSATGNPGDVKLVGEGVLELRINDGSGYRVYFRKMGQTVIVLSAGGEKLSQSKDIKTALRHLNL